ncbi:MAG TPA: MBL fold metallo-hydrolase [Flavobacteriales bacterium]
MELHSIDTGLFKLDGGAMFGVVPKTLWSKVHPADADNLCTWAMRCLLVKTGNHLVLIDNGIGDKQDQKFFGHYHLHGDGTLDTSLRKAGYSRDDITDVFLTHLHFDHCGGSIVRQGDKLVPAFRNATYWSNRYHWEWATKPNPREKASFLKENILPIQESGQLKFVDLTAPSPERFGAGAPNPSPEKRGAHPTNEYVKELFPGFDVLLVNGHTDAMMVPHLHYKGRTLIYLADLMPSVHHIPLPWVIGYDTRPLLSMQEKAPLLEKAAEEGSVLFFEHDAVNECALVERTEKGVRMKSVMPLSAV